MSAKSGGGEPRARRVGRVRCVLLLVVLLGGAGAALLLFRQSSVTAPRRLSDAVLGRLVRDVQEGKTEAILELAEAGDDRAVSHLRAEYQRSDPSSHRRSLLQMALARLGSHKEFSEIVEELGSRDEGVFSGAVEKLTYVGGARAVEALAEVMMTPEAYGRVPDPHEHPNEYAFNRYQNACTATEALYWILPYPPSVPLSRSVSLGRPNCLDEWRLWWREHRSNVGGALAWPASTFKGSIRANGALLLMHRSDVGALAFSGDGLSLVTWARPSLFDDVTVLVWDLATGERRVAIGTEGDGVRPAFSPDGTRLAVLKRERMARVDPVSRREMQTYPERIVIVNLDSRKEVQTLSNLPQAPGTAIISPANDILVCSNHRGIKIYDLKLGRETKSFDLAGPGWPVFSRDGTRLAFAMPAHFELGKESTGCYIVIWDARTFEEVRRIAAASDPKQYTLGVSLSPDGKRVAWLSSSFVGPSVWDTTTGKLLWKSDSPSLMSPRVFHVASFSPDGKLLAAAGQGPILLFDAETGRRVRRIGVPIGEIQQLSFSPDGTTIAAAGGKNVVVVAVNP